MVEKVCAHAETDVNKKDQEEHHATIRGTIEWIGLEIFLHNIQKAAACVVERWVQIHDPRHN